MSKIVINQIVHIRHMNVEIWTEAAQFPEMKYVNGIFVAVCTFQGFVPTTCEANLFPDQEVHALAKAGDVQGLLHLPDPRYAVFKGIGSRDEYYS